LREKKSYEFAFKASLTITLFLAFIMSAFLYLTIPVFYTVVLSVIFAFVFCFLVIQFRVEKYINKWVKKIYKDLNFSEENSPISNSIINTDMSMLTEEIDKFAKQKKIEIDSLKIREEYRREFLGNISHELKTPLFTVQGYIMTLIDGAVENLDIRDKYLERAGKGLDRLIYIVKDLDMISKLEMGDLSLEMTSFNLLELCDEVFDLFEIKAASKKISLIYDRDYNEPINVYADRDRILQVLSNLVVNSIKYGREKGTTEITIEDLTEDKVIIRITDNGEGINQDNISRLFERFFRVEKSRSRSIGGSGLGLSIVKHIIEAHKEHIYVESELEVGSEFSFTLKKAE
jgi:two-component system, OmpR family, phosphate regulon sensor histidine kinase PhoR